MTDAAVLDPHLHFPGLQRPGVEFDFPQLLARPGGGPSVECGCHAPIIPRNPPRATGNPEDVASREVVDDDFFPPVLERGDELVVDLVVLVGVVPLDVGEFHGQRVVP